jgi:hypothetical protein
MALFDALWLSAWGFVASLQLTTSAAAAAAAAKLLAALLTAVFEQHGRTQNRCMP